LAHPDATAPPTTSSTTLHDADDSSRTALAAIVRPPPPYEEAGRRVLEAKRDGYGTLGFTLVSAWGKSGVRVSGLLPGSAAAAAGLKPQDKLVAVNGAPVGHLEHAAVLEVLQSAGKSVSLTVQAAKGQSPILAADTRVVTLYRMPGRPLGLEIHTPPAGFGARLRASRDKGTAAGAVADIHANDVLVACNGLGMRTARHDAILSALSLQAEITLVLEPAPPASTTAAVAVAAASVAVTAPVANVAAPMRMQHVLDFDFGDSLEDSFAEMQRQSAAQARQSFGGAATSQTYAGLPRRTVTLAKKGTTLGLRVTTEVDTTGTRVAEILPNSAASASGQLQVGDRILLVNGLNVEDSSHDEVVAALRVSDTVTLVVVSDPTPLPASGHNSPAPAPADPPASATRGRRVSALPSGMPSSSPVSASPARPQSRVDKHTARMVVLKRMPGKGLGLKLVTLPTGQGARISEIIPGGVAEGTAVLAGDRILVINGRDVEYASHAEILNALRQTVDGAIHLTLVADSAPVDRGLIDAAVAGSGTTPPTTATTTTATTTTNTTAVLSPGASSVSLLPPVVVKGDPSMLTDRWTAVLKRKEGKLGFRFFSLLDAPFVRVSDVVSGSAAEDAGIRPDLVRIFLVVLLVLTLASR
jgi:C-terminal processing protease CtpA/Prc